MLAIGGIGALFASKPGLWPWALLATALAGAGLIALTLPNTASATQIVIVHVVFVALFAMVYST